MDNALSTLVDSDTPKINPMIGSGLATVHLTQTEVYIDQIFRSVVFPPGLEYYGCQRCTPAEEFALITRKRGSKRTVDVARSDIYLMKYFFKYKGVELETRYLYLPYVTTAGQIYLGGSRFSIAPILSDRVVSIGVANIFVRLPRDRLTFERANHHFMVDGKRDSTQVIFSTIYHKNAKMKKLRPTVKANCTLLHYLFCKYGFTDTFLKFGNCSPVIGSAEINTDTHPEADWVIFSSTQLKPKGCGRGFYEPTNIRIAIKKEELTPFVKNLVGSFFYIVDHFPNRILPSLEYLDSKRLWMVLLGHIIFSGSVNEGKLYDDIEDHITSLDEYLDSIVLLKLKEIGIQVSDIYQLFAVIMENFNDWLLGATDKVNSMYDKELSILYYVLYEISSAIFKLYFKLKAASKKELTAKEITATMNMILKTGLIFSITRNHGEVSNVSCSGDNMALKITSMLTPQASSSRLSSRKDRAIINDPTKRLHSSVAEIGAAFSITKSDPSGRSRINNCITIAPNGTVLRNPKFIELLDNVQSKIRR